MWIIRGWAIVFKCKKRQTKVCVITGSPNLFCRCEVITWEGLQALIEKERCLQEGNLFYMKIFAYQACFRRRKDPWSDFFHPFRFGLWLGAGHSAHSVQCCRIHTVPLQENSSSRGYWKIEQFPRYVPWLRASLAKHCDWFGIWRHSFQSCDKILNCNCGYHVVFYV